MRALVVYYSKAGHTREIAEAIVGELQGDREEIVDTASRSGPLSYFTVRRQARKGELTQIRPAEKDPARYEVVIVGTPVLLGSLSAPVRTYLKENGKKPRKVAFFATFSGSTVGTTFEEMEELCGRRPAATLAVNPAAIKDESYLDSVRQFVDMIKAAPQ